MLSSQNDILLLKTMRFLNILVSFVTIKGKKIEFNVLSISFLSQTEQ